MYIFDKSLDLESLCEGIPVDDAYGYALHLLGQCREHRWEEIEPGEEDIVAQIRAQLGNGKVPVKLSWPIEELETAAVAVEAAAEPLEEIWEGFDAQRRRVCGGRQEENVAELAAEDLAEWITSELGELRSWAQTFYRQVSLVERAYGEWLKVYAGWEDLMGAYRQWEELGLDLPEQ